MTRPIRGVTGFLLLTTFGTAGCVLPGRHGRQPSATNATAGRPTPDLAALLARMTLDEKIGQMTQADLRALRDEGDVAKYGIGSVLSGGDSMPLPNTASAWADTYDRLAAHAIGTRLGIPLLYGIDAVHGANGLKGAVIFPHNVGLGCTRNEQLVERVARATAQEVAGTGIDWTFAPCLAVPRDERWGRTYEGFGETAELASTLGAAAVRGYQGKDLGAPDSVLACAKHFVADGATKGGKDQGDAQITEAELRAIHLPGYQAAIKAGVGSVMISYSSWNGRPMHGNRELITGVLKGELGFQGFVVTDWAAIDKMPGDYTSDVETAINAGIDMVMVPQKYPEFIRTLRALVNQGRVSQERIDDAVMRILKQKAALRLWERPFVERRLTDEIGSRAHRDLARQAVRQSLVLLKNEQRALPLRKTGQRVLLAGARADDLGVQCGGWTVSWQGRRGAITPGTTIKAALETALGGSLRYAADGDDKDADAVVVVVGENPYAEFRGDRQNLALPPEDVALVHKLKRAGRPLIVVLLSGRPLILGDVLADADALVAAWLPGTEGDGVADVLVGDAKPVGKLSHSWPRTMAQIPINQGDSAYDPLFPYGFGLSY